MTITIALAGLNILFAVLCFLKGDIQFAANHTLLALCLINKSETDSLGKKLNK